MSKTLKTFIVLSLVIAALETVFVAQIYRQQKLTFEEHLQEKIEQVRSSFDLALSNSRQRMSELASYVAHSPAIQQAFLAGRKAVEREGGGSGGPAAERARAELLALSQESWCELEKGFDFRKMHYHLPGKATSFLRVHRPEKYGDQLAPFRPMLTAAHEKQVLLSGLEAGRSDFVIRGIAPVFAHDPDVARNVYVGTLEFATSLGQSIADIAKNQDVELAVMLDVEQLEALFWPQVLRQRAAEAGVFDGFLVEAASFASAGNFFQNEDVSALLSPQGMNLHPDRSGYHWLASFPLDDYQNQQATQGPAIGRVIISRDATSSILALQNNLRNNIIIAVLGFIIIEALLFMACRITTRKLEQVVEAGRKELEIKNLKLEDDLVERKNLQRQREELIEELLEAAEDIKALSGLLPICSYCKKIRDDDGYWRRLETYIESHSSAQFSHGICKECLDVNFPEAADEVSCSHLVEGTLKRI